MPPMAATPDTAASAGTGAMASPHATATAPPKTDHPAAVAVIQITRPGQNETASPC